jgi:hypothetical protein
MTSRQLDIFTRRAAHPRKGNAAVEFRMHCMVADMLKRWW